jgi:hypothetical protein
MREIRTYGSVRGVARKGHPYRDKIGQFRRPSFCPTFFLPTALKITIDNYSIFMYHYGAFERPVL